MRHGQAISNFLSDTLGPDVWYTLEETCAYDDKNGTIYEIFDARGCRDDKHSTTHIGHFIFTALLASAWLAM